MTDKIDTSAEAVKAALDAATPGPWRAGASEFYPGLDGPLTTRVYTGSPVEEVDVSGNNCRSNARLIAMARDLAIDCLTQAEEINQLRADLTEARTQVAAAYEAAAKAMGEYHWNRYHTKAEGGELTRPAVFNSHTHQAVDELIRALTPADATAALAEREKAAERRGIVLGLERSAQIADYAGAKQMPSDGSYSRHEPVMGPDIAAAIRAETEWE